MSRRFTLASQPSADAMFSTSTELMPQLPARGPYTVDQPVGLDYSLFGRGGGDLIAASFYRNTTLGVVDLYSKKHGLFGIDDPNFKPMEHLLPDYPYSDRDIELLSESRNFEEFMSRHVAIGRTRYYTGVQNNAGFFSNLGADVVTAFVDPISYIPFGGIAAKGGEMVAANIAKRVGMFIADDSLRATLSVLKTGVMPAYRTARTVGSFTVRPFADALGAEAVLYALDDERTLGSMAIDTLAGTMFQAGIGGAGRLMNSRTFQLGARGLSRVLAYSEIAAERAMGLGVDAMAIPATRMANYAAEDVGIRAKINRHVREASNGREVEVSYGPIKKRFGPGREIAAREVTPDGRVILHVDTAALRRGWEKKVWTKTAIKGVAPLKKNAFKSFEQWTAFVIEHEIIHDELGTVHGDGHAANVDLENKINRMAFDRVVENDGSHFDHLPFVNSDGPDGSPGRILDEDPMTGDFHLSESMDDAIEKDLLENANLKAGRQVLEKSFGAAWLTRLSSPALRVATSSSRVARRAAEQLVNTPWVTKLRQAGLTAGPSVEARARVWYGRMVTADVAHRDLYRKMKARLKGEGKRAPSRHDFNVAVGRAMRYADELASAEPEVKLAVAEWKRRLYNPVIEDAVNLGLIKKEDVVEGNYLHRLYDKVLLAQDEEGFVGTLTAYFKEQGIDPEGAYKAAQAAYDHLLTQPEGRVNPGDVRLRGAIKGRTLNVPDKLIDKWLVHDIEKVSFNYAKVYGTDVELQRVFGDPSMTGHLKMIADDYDRMIAAAEAKLKAGGEAKYADLLKGLQKEKEQTLNAMTFFRDSMRNVANLPEDPMSIASRLPAVIRNFTYSGFSGFFAIANLPDIATPVGMFGVNDVFKHAWLPYIKQLKQGAMRLSKQNALLAGQAAEVVNGYVIADMTNTQTAFGNIPHRHHSMTKLQRMFGFVESAGAKSAELSSKLTLLAPMLDAIHEMNSIVINHKIMDAAIKVSQGVELDASTKELMAGFGLNKGTLNLIGNVGRDHIHVEGDTIMPRIDQWGDLRAARAFLSASAQAADHLNNMPGPGDKPLFFQGQMLKKNGRGYAPAGFSAHAQAELGKMQTMFMSYAFASMSRVFLTRIQRRDWPALQGFIASMGLGAIAYTLRQVASGQQVTDDPMEFAAQSFDKSGMSGWLMNADRVAGAATNGNFGVNAFLDNPATRWTPEAAFAHFLGAPGSWAYNTASSVVGGAGQTASGGHPDRGTMRNLVRQLPFMNLFYVRALLEAVKSSQDSAAVVEEERFMYRG